MSTIHYKYKGSKERHRGGGGGGGERATEILHIQCKSFEQLSLYNKLYNLVLGIMHTRNPVAIEKFSGEILIATLVQK